MTTDEIVRALRICVHVPDNSGGDCYNCPAVGSERCMTETMNGAADLIEQLTAENVILPDGQASAIETLRKEIEWKDMVIALTQRKQAEAEAERDALLEYAKLFTGCDTCKHSNYCKTDSECNACEQDVKGNCYCKDCERGSNWEWRGLPEAPEGGETHGTINV